MVFFFLCSGPAATPAPVRKQIKTAPVSFQTGTLNPSFQFSIFSHKMSDTDREKRRRRRHSEDRTRDEDDETKPLVKDGKIE